jgi:uncharacterized protein YbjT (DUF2867 family)
MKRVLVAGATGYLGRYLVKESKNQGYHVSALARNTNKISDLDEYIDDLIHAEVTNPDSLKGICEDIDYVISSVGISRQKDGLTFMDVDYRGNRNLLDEAVRSGVSKFIFVSVINAHLMKDLKVIEAKEKFVNELIDSGLDYAVIRPTGFFSDMLEFLNMAKKGKVSLFGNGENKINPIHGSDLAEVCVKAIAGDDKEINVGGPETFKYKEIGELTFKVLNRKPKISLMPEWLIKIIITLMRVFTPSTVYGPVEFFMTVMTMDVVGNTYGKKRLEEFYKENLDK